MTRLNFYLLIAVMAVSTIGSTFAMTKIVDIEASSMLATSDAIYLAARAQRNARDCEDILKVCVQTKKALIGDTLKICRG